MDRFTAIPKRGSDEETIDGFVDCVVIIMEQFDPSIASREQVEDLFDIETIYKALEHSAGISIKSDNKETVTEQAKSNDDKWEDLNIVSLESELFLLGIWKDYEELETSLSMPELITTLNAKRDRDYNEKRFFAAIQGVDLDKNSKKAEDDPWEAMKARVFSKGKISDPNDIASYQGAKATKAGFGVGMGLGYEDLRKK